MTLKYLEMVRVLSEQQSLRPPVGLTELATIRDAYIENIERIYSLAGLGMQIEVNTRSGKKGRSDASSRPLTPPEVETAAAYIDELASQKQRVSYGVIAMMDGMLTSGWTAFEVLASDLWEAVINAHPSGLADLSGSPKRIGKLSGARKQQANLNQDGPGKSVLLSEIQRVTSGSFEINHKWGTLLKGLFNFSTLAGIREAYSKAFSAGCKNCKDIDACLADTSLNALSLVRNLLIHKSGIADAEYCNRMGESLSVPKLQIGQRLQNNGELVVSLLVPALECSTKLLGLINTWIAYADEERANHTEAAYLAHIEEVATKNQSDRDVYELTREHDGPEE